LFDTQTIGTSLNMVSKITAPPIQQSLKVLTHKQIKLFLVPSITLNKKVID